MFFTILGYLWSLLGYISNNFSFPKPLSPLEEKELLLAFWNGNHDARDKLIEHNLRLVSHICKKFKTLKIDKDDMLSIGSIGLIKGVDTYKLGNNTRLATYLSRCIENEILMSVRKNKNNKQGISLDECVGTDKSGKEFSLIEMLYDEDDDVFTNISKKIDIEKIYELICDRLDERERKVIIMRYGLDNTKPMTQMEVSEILEISRSYVSRIETAALKKLVE